ncbi:hypothetical protein HTZ85_14460 [Escherichia coli]|nr:hypothetical protein [Escherichia coli]
MKVITSKSVSPAISLPPCSRQPTVTVRYVRRWRKKRQYASLTSLFAQLFIELAEWHSPLYLVIDDYHLITNPVIH